MDVRDVLVRFISEELDADNKTVELTDSTSLIDFGVIDSLGIMKLLAFFEKEFSITIDGDELTPDNFENVETIVRMVKSKIIL